MRLEHFNRRCDIRADFTFTVRAEPLPGDLRPDWRIALILIMIMGCGWRGSMALKKLHLVCSAASSAPSRGLLLRMLDGVRNLDDVPLRIDPSLNRAIDYAIAEGLLAASVKSKTLSLEVLPHGKEFYDKVMAAIDCMEQEKRFADQLRGRLSSEKVEEILNWETRL